ncbi:MAG: patatin-like phospholipase family protein [Acidobacteriia bacterium]|nr:patatin-like phospholipase family protein [Terriglobia bacterium]
MRTAVILSGGGAKSAYEAGVLKALEDNNVQVDLVIGTSAGALNALFYAVGETDRLYNGQGTGLWQRLSKKLILRDGLLSSFYSRVVSRKLGLLFVGVSLLNLLLFSIGFVFAYGITGRSVNYGRQSLITAFRALKLNFTMGLFYGTLVLVLVLFLEYLFIGSVLHTIYRWLKIKLGFTPLNDETLAELRNVARRIPGLTKSLLTRSLGLPADVMNPDRLLESIRTIDPPAYFSSAPMEELLRHEVRDILQKRTAAAEGVPETLAASFMAWYGQKLQAEDSQVRGLMITATDLNAKAECLFFALKEPYRRGLVIERLKRYRLDTQEQFIRSQGIDHSGPDYVDLLFEDNGQLLFDALIASTSIIGVFPPRKIKLPAKGYWRAIEPAHTFVDGGFGNNTPIRDAIEAGATHLIVIQVEPKNVVETLSHPSELNATLPCLMRTVETVLDTTVDDDYRYYELWNRYAPEDQRIQMAVIQPRSSLSITTLDFDGGLSASGNRVALSSACARGYSDALKQFIYSEWTKWKSDIPDPAAAVPQP